MNAHEMTINAIELASELADKELEKKFVGIIWEEDSEGFHYTENAQDEFNDLYDHYLTLIENCKIQTP